MNNKVAVYVAIYDDGMLGVAHERQALERDEAAIVWVAKVVIGPKGGATIRGGFTEARAVSAA